jgi:hypothetical protein
MALIRFVTKPENEPFQKRLDRKLFQKKFDQKRLGNGVINRRNGCGATVVFDQKRDNYA